MGKPSGTGEIVGAYGILTGLGGNFPLDRSTCGGSGMHENALEVVSAATDCSAHIGPAFLEEERP